MPRVENESSRGDEKPIRARLRKRTCGERAKKSQRATKLSKQSREGEGGGSEGEGAVRIKTKGEKSGAHDSQVHL